MVSIWVRWYSARMPVTKDQLKIGDVVETEFTPSLGVVVSLDAYHEPIRTFTGFLDNDGIAVLLIETTVADAIEEGMSHSCSLKNIKRILTDAEVMQYMLER